MLRLGGSLTLLVLVSAHAGAQRVQLALRPKAGDTVSMRLDQTTEMSGTRQNVAAGQTTASGTREFVTTLRMFSRAIVESNAPDAAMILAITDSVDLYTSDEQGRALARQALNQLEGRQMRLKLSPDGTVGIPDKVSSVPKEVTDLVSVMPASFPKEMVAVGETWERQMPIPPAPNMGVPFGGVVKASFRLDSISPGGAVAYVSMRGTLQDALASGANQPSLSGTVTGSMVVDRKRGWLSESRFLIQMRTTVANTEPQSSTATKTPPMLFRLRITQHMRVSDKR